MNKAEQAMALMTEALGEVEEPSRREELALAFSYRAIEVGVSSEPEAVYLKG